MSKAGRVIPGYHLTWGITILIPDIDNTSRSLFIV